jgi:hypothetical protein
VIDPASDYTQRWRAHAHSWRHVSEGGFDRRRFDVALLGRDAEAKAFVVAHHYSRSYPAARLRVGLFCRDELVGVAVFGVPMRARVLTAAFPGLVPYHESLELSRFVLLDEVPANAESWFLARAFRLVAGEGLRGAVAFADPVPRLLADGTLLSPGHVGTVYQASNGLYAAQRGTQRTLLLGPDGRVVSARGLQKVRGQERGHEYVERTLVEWGASPRSDRGEDPSVWLRCALQRAGVTRVRHPGNYRYLFRLGRTRAERTRVVIGLAAAAYPKKDAA